MRKNITFIIATLLTVVLIVLLYMQQNSKKAPGAEVIKRSPQGDPFLVVPLNPADPKHTQKGSATFFDEGKGNIRVLIQVTDLKIASQTASIQQGSCEFPARIAFSFIPLSNGRSETVINTSQKQLQLLKPWVVNITNPAPDIRHSTACGEFK